MGNSENDSDSSDLACNACGFEAAYVPEGMITCDFCDHVWYCSSHCKEWDWNSGGHARACKRTMSGETFTEPPKTSNKEPPQLTDEAVKPVSAIVAGINKRTTSQDTESFGIAPSQQTIGISVATSNPPSIDTTPTTSQSLNMWESKVLSARTPGDTPSTIVSSDEKPPEQSPEHSSKNSSSANSTPSSRTRSSGSSPGSYTSQGSPSSTGNSGHVDVEGSHTVDSSSEQDVLKSIVEESTSAAGEPEVEGSWRTRDPFAVKEKKEENSELSQVAEEEEHLGDDVMQASTTGDDDPDSEHAETEQTTSPSEAKDSPGEFAAKRSTALSDSGPPAKRQKEPETTAAEVDSIDEPAKPLTTLTTEASMYGKFRRKLSEAVPVVQTDPISPVQVGAATARDSETRTYSRYRQDMALASKSIDSSDEAPVQSSISLPGDAKYRSSIGQATSSTPTKEESTTPLSTRYGKYRSGLIAAEGSASEQGISSAAETLKGSFQTAREKAELTDTHQHALIAQQSTTHYAQYRQSLARDVSGESNSVSQESHRDSTNTTGAPSSRYHAYRNAMLRDQTERSYVSPLQTTKDTACAEEQDSGVITEKAEQMDNTLPASDTSTGVIQDQERKCENALSDKEESEGSVQLGPGDDDPLIALISQHTGTSDRSLPANADEESDEIEERLTEYLSRSQKGLTTSDPDETTPARQGDEGEGNMNDNAVESTQEELLSQEPGSSSMAEQQQSTNEDKLSKAPEDDEQDKDNVASDSDDSDFDYNYTKRRVEPDAHVADTGAASIPSLLSSDDGKPDNPVTAEPSQPSAKETQSLNPRLVSNRFAASMTASELFKTQQQKVREALAQTSQQIEVYSARKAEKNTHHVSSGSEGGSTVPQKRPAVEEDPSSSVESTRPSKKKNKRQQAFRWLVLLILLTVPVAIVLGVTLSGNGGGTRQIVEQQNSSSVPSISPETASTYGPTDTVRTESPTSGSISSESPTPAPIVASVAPAIPTFVNTAAPIESQSPSQPTVSSAEPSSLHAPSGSPTLPSLRPSRGRTLNPSLSPSSGLNSQPTLRPSSPQEASVPTGSPVHASGPPSFFASRVPVGVTSLPTTTPIAATIPTAGPVELSPPPSPSASPSQSGKETKPPTTSNYTELLELLSSWSEDGARRLQTPGTPQRLAFDWLSQESSIASYSDRKKFQRYSLATFFYSTNGSNWTESDGWLSEADECGWFSRSSRIPVCDATGSVRNLDLGFNSVGGTLPPELALLSDLSRLELSGRTSVLIGGTIPPEFGQLSRLISVDLSGNEFSGTIPNQIGNWLSVAHINLGWNKLSGSIPDVFNGMASLRELNFELNSLSGEIPSSFSGLSSLEKLFLNTNRLSGSFPSHIAGLANLTQLNLAQNRFTSLMNPGSSLFHLETLNMKSNNITTISSTIGELSSLRTLFLSENSISGSIPTEIGLLINIRNMDLSKNKLQGSLPSEIGSLSLVRDLFLQSNELNGSIPTEVASLSRLSQFRIDDNNVSGRVPEDVCAAFATTLPRFYLDCGGSTPSVTCPVGSCCTYCCDETGCTCEYEGTSQAYLC